MTATQQQKWKAGVIFKLDIERLQKDYLKKTERNEGKTIDSINHVVQTAALMNEGEILYVDIQNDYPNDLLEVMYGICQHYEYNFQSEMDTGNTKEVYINTCKVKLSLRRKDKVKYQLSIV